MSVSEARRCLLVCICFLIPWKLANATGWGLPSLTLKADSSSSNNSSKSNFVTEFDLHTRVNATEERMYFHSELVVANLLETIFGTSASDEKCLQPRLGENEDVAICDLRFLDFDTLSKIGEFKARGLANLSMGDSPGTKIPIEFSVLSTVKQTGRDVSVGSSILYPGSVPPEAREFLPTSADFVYRLEPCFERHEVKIDSVDYLRASGKFAVNSHASTLWAQGALGCRSRHASRK